MLVDGRLSRAAVELAPVPMMVVDAAGEPVVMNQAWRAAHGLDPARELSSWEALSGCRRVFAADGVTPLTEEQLPSRRALAGLEGDQEVVVAAGGGRRRWRCTARAVRDEADRVIGAVVTALDVSAAEGRARLLARHARQLTAVAEASRAVLREQDARATVCRAAASVCEALAVLLWEPDRHGDLVVTAATTEELVGMRLPPDQPSQVAQVLATGRPLTSQDLLSEPGVNQPVILRAAELIGRPVGAGLWIPVLHVGSGDHARGVLTIALAAGATDLAGHIPVLEILAGEAAVAIERQDLLTQLKAQAGTDPLTMIGNRRRWDTEAPARLQAAAVTGEPVSVMIADVDHFKQYNDTHGHPAGDALLRDLARTWTSRLRPQDLLCRIGGEEFAILLPGCDTTAALSVADDLRALTTHRRTVSIGVATWDRREPLTDLIARADTALYQAKHGGRDRSVALSTGKQQPLSGPAQGLRFP